MTAPSPAQQAQRRVLEGILATGCASPALAAAATTFSDPFDALRSLPVTGYEPYAAAARGCVDALRSGDVPTARGHLAALLARVAETSTDPTHVLGFLQTSGTSGNACKFFPLTRAAQEARSTNYGVVDVLARAKQAGVHDDGVRLSLVTPGLPVELPSLLVDDAAAGTEADTTTAPASTPASPLDRMVDPAGLRMTRVGPATAVMLGPVLKHLATQPADAPDVASDTDIMGGATLAFPVRIVCAFDASPAAKHYLMWLCTLAKGGDRVTQMADFFGGSILSAVGVLREHAGSIAAALRAGRLSAGFPGDTFAGASISDAVRAEVDAYIGGPQPAAADALEAALASGEPLLAVLFPRLKFVSAIFTGSMAKYAPRVAALCPPGTILATDFYGGSEGYYGSAIELMTPGPRKADPRNRLVLAPASDVFFEFLQVGKEDDPPVLLTDVTPDTNYEVVITTYGGLARYRIGDVIRVVGFAAIDAAALAGGDAGLEADLHVFNGAPIVEFVGRAGAMLNLVWEKYDEAALVAALGLHPWAEFAIREEPAPQGGGLPHYVVYVEPPAGGELDGKAVATAVETALRTQNEIYALLITRGQIAPAVVAVTRHGAFAALKESAIARGASAAQYKAPVCLESSADGLRAGVLEGWVVERVQAKV